MFDLISIGNISMDMYFKGDSLTYEGDRFTLAIGGKYFVDKFHQGIGGGGANVAIGAARHGCRAAVVGKLGNNVFRRIILSDLTDAGVNHSLCSFEEEYLNISAILLSPKGERSIINFDTPHQHIIRDDRDLEPLARARVVYLGNLPDVSFTEREEITHFLHRRGVPIAVNLGVKDCRRPIDQIEKFLKPVDVILVNSYEYAELIKKDHKRLDLSASATYRHPMIKDKAVIVTDGANGSFGYADGVIHYQKAIPVKEIVDTTGAGDGFVSAFLAEYIKSGDMRHAMKEGAYYAAHILQKLGAN